VSVGARNELLGYTEQAGSVWARLRGRTSRKNPVKQLTWRVCDGARSLVSRDHGHVLSGRNLPARCSTSPMSKSKRRSPNGELHVDR